MLDSQTGVDISGEEVEAGRCVNDSGLDINKTFSFPSTARLKGGGDGTCGKVRHLRLSEFTDLGTE